MNTIIYNGDDLMVPLKFHLSQNYPNPFNGKTKIKYCIAYETKVTITILNLKKEIMEILLNEEQKAGTYEIEFDAGDLVKGIYLFQIKAGDYLNTKKMLIKNKIKDSY
jgi:hypothetical protein